MSSSLKTSQDSSVFLVLLHRHQDKILKPLDKLEYRVHGAYSAKDLWNLVLPDVCQPICDEKCQEFVESGDPVSVVDLLQGQLRTVQAGQAGKESGQCTLKLRRAVLKLEDL